MTEGEGASAWTNFRTYYTAFRCTMRIKKKSILYSSSLHSATKHILHKNKMEDDDELFTVAIQQGNIQFSSPLSDIKIGHCNRNNELPLLTILNPSYISIACRRSLGMRQSCLIVQIVRRHRITTSSFNLFCYLLGHNHVNDTL